MYFLLKFTGGPLWKWMDVKIGGKIERRAVLIGVVSRSIGCARQYPGIYTKVSSVLKWINTYINSKPKFGCSNEIKGQSQEESSSRQKSSRSSSSKKSPRNKKNVEKTKEKKDYIVWGK